MEIWGKWPKKLKVTKVDIVAILPHSTVGSAHPNYSNMGHILLVNYFINTLSK